MRVTNRRLAQIVAMTVLFGCHSAQAGNIFRWVGEDGVVHYGDAPAIGSEPVAVRNGKPVPPPRGEDDESEEETLAEIRENQCEKARQRYAQYNDSSKIVETDAFGKKRELSAEERLTTIARAKGDVETYCNEE